jgi:hypothetical protein
MKPTNTPHGKLQSLNVMPVVIILTVELYVLKEYTLYCWKLAGWVKKEGTRLSAVFYSFIT